MSESKQPDSVIPAAAKTADEAAPSDVLIFKQRMLEWPNPVEYVNNMYGCHPGDKNTGYFKTVFGK
ncbi:MAG: hypothetical protein ABSF26_09900 [Thermoguttaceae bacterium]|jgi:hypothetical protein